MNFFDGHSAGLVLWGAFDVRPPSPRRVDEGVDSVGRAVVPHDSTLALCRCRVFLELAMFAMDRPEPFSGS